MKVQEITETVSALLTPVIAILAVYIAYQQHQTNLKRELRESRQAKIECYRKVALFFNNTCWNSKVSEKDFEMLGEAIAEADFLFPKDLTDWLDEVYSSALQWRHYDQHINDYANRNDLSREEMKEKYSGTPEWASQEDDMEDLMEKLHEANFVLKEMFAVYIKVL
jgi:hypothetical protein